MRGCRASAAGDGSDAQTGLGRTSGPQPLARSLGSGRHLMSSIFSHRTRRQPGALSAAPRGRGRSRARRAGVRGVARASRDRRRRARGIATRVRSRRRARSIVARQKRSIAF
eukprot:29333-Pelagococcus_subviridis.AAC.2